MSKTTWQRMGDWLGGVSTRMRGGPLRDPALVNLFGGSSATSGVAVNEDTAMRYAPVFQAVTLISETIASLPLITYERTETRRRRAVDHPVYELLHDQPAPNMPATPFRAALVSHGLVWGNGYAEIERAYDSRPCALHLLLPNHVEPFRDNAGEVFYRYRVPGMDSVVLPSCDVFHLRGPSFDGLVGYGKIRLARESIGLGLAAEQFGSALFGRGAKPSGVLEHPGRLSDDARMRLRGDFERMHSGIENAHRVAILEEGMRWTTLGIPPDDAQFLQTRQFQLGDIARWFNIPLSKLRDASASSYKSLEQDNLAFLSECLRPWLIRIEQEIRCKLFNAVERRTYYSEHLVEGLLRADQSARYNAYAIGRNWGWLSANEIRERENLDPIPGGDTYLEPMNMQALNAPSGPSAVSGTPAITVAQGE